MTTKQSLIEQVVEVLERFATEGDKWHKIHGNDFVPLIDTGHLCDNCGQSNKDEPRAAFSIGDLRAARTLLTALKAAPETPDWAEELAIAVEHWFEVRTVEATTDIDARRELERALAAFREGDKP